MGYYYDRVNQAFLHDSINTIDDNAIELSDSEYNRLIEKSTQGCEIVVIEDKVIATPPKPTIYHTWDGEKWIVDEVKKAEIRAYFQNQVWSEIKQKRYNNGRLGVYVKSVNKWFHTDDASRQQ